MGFIFFALLAPLLASPFELNASVATETRAGEAPVLGTTVSDRFVAELITPQAEAELRQEQLDVRLAYSPRLFWQAPNALGRTFRPLLLNQATLSLSAQPSATTKIAARAFGSYGEPDYTILSQIIGSMQGMPAPGSGQPSVPQVLKILTVAANLGIQTDLSRRFRLTFGVDATHFRPLADLPPVMSQPGVPMPPPSAVYLTQTTVTATPGATFRVTPEDDLALTVGTAYSTYSSTYSCCVELLLVSPMLSWRMRRQAGDELRLGLGFTEARDLGSISVLGGHPVLSPTGSVEALWHVGGEDEYGLTARLKATVDEFVDPILGVAYPRGLVAGQLLLVLAPDWSVSVQGDFGTSLQTSPAIPTSNTTAPSQIGSPDETAFSISVPVRHRLSGNLIMEFGGRWAERAPAIAASHSSI